MCLIRDSNAHPGLPVPHKFGSSRCEDSDGAHTKPRSSLSLSRPLSFFPPLFSLSPRFAVDNKVDRRDVRPAVVLCNLEAYIMESHFQPVVVEAPEMFPRRSSSADHRRASVEPTTSESAFRDAASEDHLRVIDLKTAT